MGEKKNWKERWNLADSFRYLYTELKKEYAGLSLPYYFFDAIVCLSKYGATFHDYINLHFDRKDAKTRETFLTTKLVQREKNKWDKEAVDAIDNKMKFNQLFSDHIGREWIDISKSSFEDFSAFVSRHPTFFVKDKRESSGRGTHKYELSEVNDLKELYEDILKQDALVEEKVEMCEELNRLNPSSISQIRVVTVCGSKDVNILAASLRTGVHVPFNYAGDDLIAQIDIDSGTVVTEGISEGRLKHAKHPVSGAPIKGMKIPRWEELLSVCKNAAKSVPEVRVIGWDVVVTEDDICFIEGNPGSGVASMQIADDIGKKALFYKYLNE